MSLSFNKVDSISNAFN